MQAKQRERLAEHVPLAGLHTKKVPPCMMEPRPVYSIHLTTKSQTHRRGRAWEDGETDEFGQTLRNLFGRKPDACSAQM
jgi:hypothetical protein